MAVKTVTPMIVLLALVAGCAAKAPAPEKQVETNLAQPTTAAPRQPTLSF